MMAADSIVFYVCLLGVFGLYFFFVEQGFACMRQTSVHTTLFFVLHDNREGRGTKRRTVVHVRMRCSPFALKTCFLLRQMHNRRMRPKPDEGCQPVFLVWVQCSKLGRICIPSFLLLAE